MGEHDSILRDTSLEATRAYFAVLRRMTPDERVKQALELSDQMCAVLEAGVRHRHPEYDEQQVRLATIRLRLGTRLFREVHPGVEVRP
jgi:hypothetical protein